MSFSKKSSSVPDDDEDEDDGAVEVDNGDGPTKILPKQPGEFCVPKLFLAEARKPVADPAKGYCRDCA